MKKDIVITVDTLTSMVYKDTATMGIVKENIESNIIFKFNKGFVDGVAWLEFDDGVNKGYLEMQKVDETYTLPIKSSLLSQKGKINLQLRITQSENPNGIPVYKSNIFYMNVLEALNTTTEIPDDYPTWIEIADAKILEVNEAIQEVERLNITATKENKTTTITITDKQGIEHETQVLDGENGIGLNYNWQNTSLGVKREDETNYTYTDLKGDIGDSYFSTFGVEDDGNLYMYRAEEITQINFELDNEGYLVELMEV